MNRIWGLIDFRGETTSGGETTRGEMSLGETTRGVNGLGAKHPGLLVSSRPESSRPCQISAWFHIKPFFSMLVGMCLIKKGLFNKSWKDV